ncbi:MAG: 4-(cytidine 5'-diphospho)-2-C-methyl-D-erythritol kinase [Gammaproteobacteria bacterium]|nr:4-(cytidine 5'-diphospho)-2-C-methyl-D-erythritol kinase [Gammaproteobacteria bacterium]MBI5619093.1 4-(cytidine 5'-diphospho)-2-C-methyl-D-erythritol kinase [Gammaproteobacteria bacterium]
MDARETLSRGWPAPAKINLFLHVVGRRPDGYHLLQTLFQFLDYGDEISFRLRQDGTIGRLNELAGVPADSDLVVRAARVLKEATGTRWGADIDVAKVLPMGGGLGGGSSNAATVLVGLNALWGTGLDTAALAQLGLGLGADVPVFVHGVAAWAEGVGELLTPCDQEELPVLVVFPGCQVPTAAVFTHPDLTRNTPAIKIQRFSLAESHNDCEPVTRRLYPAVGEALDRLSRYAPTRMSGTGACVFACFATREAAEAAGRELPAAWQWFTAGRRNRSPLLDRLEAEHRARDGEPPR